MPQVWVPILITSDIGLSAIPPRILLRGLQWIFNGSVDGNTRGVIGVSLKLDNLHQRLHLRFKGVGVQT
jgi:hypothetical protein